MVDFHTFVTEIFRFKVCHFQDFSIFEIWKKLWILNEKISVTKFWKSKFWIDSFVAFFMGFVVAYHIFSVSAIFLEKFAK